MYLICRKGEYYGEAGRKHGAGGCLDAGQIKRLLKIASATNHGDRDQTVIVLSYWLGLHAKELASLKLDDVLRWQFRN